MTKHVYVRGAWGELVPEVSAELRCARERRGYSRAELATALGCSTWYVAALEGGSHRRRPSAAFAEALVDVLRLEETADGRGLAMELRVLSAPRAGRSKVGFYQRTLAEKAAAARAARAKKRDALRAAAADSLDSGSELSVDP